MMRWTRILFFFAYATCSFAMAQLPKDESPQSTATSPGDVAQPRSGPIARKPKLEPGKTIRIDFKNPGWNTNSTELDSGSVLLRNSETGQIVQIELVETAPDSGEFAGHYFINLGSHSISPEIYLLDSNELKKPKNTAPLEDRLRNGSLPRSPIILHTTAFGIKTLSIFHSPEEAIAAKEEYQKDSGLSKLAQQPQPVVSQATLETAAAQAKILERKKLEEEARKREAQRVAEQDHAQREMEGLLKKQKSLATAEKEKQRVKARQYSENAMEFFRVGVFPEAEKNFRTAFELDPENKSYFYQYGVALFKNNKYNESLIYLKLADGPTVPKDEKSYYMGLNFFKLKEYQKARIEFDVVRKSGVKLLAISGEFYRAIIEFDNQNYDEAQTMFQKVMDDSDDPKMDQAAEDYIDQIVKIKWFIANKAKKIIITVGVGPEFDSNVLLQSDVSPSQTQSQKGSTRINGSASVEYRPVFSETTEFSVKAATDTQYTSNYDLSPADSLSYLVGPIYRYKGALFGKGYKLELNPNYILVYNDPVPTGTKIKIFQSIPVNINQTFVMNDNWFSSINFSYSSDTSYLPASTSADDASANKIVLDLNQVLFQDKKKTTAWIPDYAFTLNNATGTNFRYTKHQVSLGYLMPLGWDVTFIPKLSTYYLNYPLKTVVRTDQDVKVDTTFSRPFFDWLSVTLNTAYIMNKSTVPESYQYNKFDITLLANMNFSF